MGSRLSRLESVLATISDDVGKLQVWPSLQALAQPSSTDINQIVVQSIQCKAVFTLSYMYGVHVCRT